MIIGISGKKQSGKDTVGKIIQYLTNSDAVSKGDYNYYLKYGMSSRTTWSIHKYADALKQIVSILTGISVEDLEKEEVKNSVLREEWDTFVDIEFPKLSGEEIAKSDNIKTIVTYKQLTVRELLQKVGTEVGRQIHPNAWINCLFSKYRGYYTPLKDLVDNAKDAEIFNKVKHPNWIITDVRFPNELKAIEDRGGFVIRVNRLTQFQISAGAAAIVLGVNEEISDKAIINYEAINHPSETSLDDYPFFHVINNNGSIEELIEQVKQILIKEKII